MKVCVVSDRDPRHAVGGGELSLLELLRALKEHSRDLEILVVALAPHQRTVEQGRIDGLKIVTVPFLFDNTIVPQHGEPPRRNDLPKIVRLAMWHMPIRPLRRWLRGAVY